MNARGPAGWSSVFGTSAKWLALNEKEGRRPRETHDLSALEAILSTGSPLAAHSFDYVYEHVKSDVRVRSGWLHLTLPVGHSMHRSSAFSR